ncbi:restriction endonuclease subunit S [Methylotetracoccus oryzae]|uniref:restriction endonuclease subunit S n=1 Tax=Methylotetracoccus oryzae TaxID=1919059 RepID=UPI001119B603|nr:restriction endonuclease subunit S [Methylotetracoccus oryzae]
MDCVLKDLITVSKDGEWGKGEPFDDSVEMLAIRGTDFEEIRFGSTANTPRRHIARRHAERKVLQPWDLIIEAAGGTKNQITGRTVLLRPQLFSRSEFPFTCASFSRFIRFNTELCDPAFMFWYLQDLYNSGAMHAYHTQHTGVARFQWTTFSEREPLTLPPLPVQRRIAGILSAYDELIENSQRRIKILESMARALYREWFVHFRFPGHDSVPRVASPLGEIPQGWEVKKLGEICVVTDYVANGSFASLKQNVQYRDEPDYAILIRGTDFNSGWNGKYVHVTEGSYQFLRKSELHPGDIVVTNVGNVGTTFFVPDLGKPMTLGPNSVLVRPHMGTNFVFHYLRSDEGQHRIRGITSGVAQPKFNKTEFRALNVATPPHALLQQFDNVVAPIHAMSDKLRASCTNLRRTRDLLLPRLLLGQALPLNPVE